MPETSHPQSRHPGYLALPETQQKCLALPYVPSKCWVLPEEPNRRVSIVPVSPVRHGDGWSWAMHSTALPDVRRL